MPSKRIRKEFKDRIYFVTLSIYGFNYLFDRHIRWEILLDSLKYCQHNKGLKFFNWVFMINHIHLIIQSLNVISFIRDFKSFTTKELKRNILATEPNLINNFVNKKGLFHIWQQNNMPKLIETEEFYINKAEYIENNPVRKLYVNNSENWYYSSANKLKLLELDNVLE